MIFSTALGRDESHLPCVKEAQDEDSQPSVESLGSRCLMIVKDPHCSFYSRTASRSGHTVVVISCTIGERRGQTPIPDIGALYETADVTSVFVAPALA